MILFCGEECRNLKIATIFERICNDWVNPRNKGRSPLPPPTLYTARVPGLVFEAPTNIKYSDESVEKETRLFFFAFREKV